jgi:hypothetical protein
MSLIQELSDITVAMENEQETRQEVYTLLMRAMLEIRQLTHELAVLKNKETT